jgi:hypothetical protein
LHAVFVFHRLQPPGRRKSCELPPAARQEEYFFLSPGRRKFAVLLAMLASQPPLLELVVWIASLMSAVGEDRA